MARPNDELEVVSTLWKTNDTVVLVCYKVTYLFHLFIDIFNDLLQSIGISPGPTNSSYNKMAAGYND